MSTRRFRPWTEAERAKARELVPTDIHPDAFYAQVGRTKDAARSHLKWVDDAVYRAYHAAQNMARRAAMPKSLIVPPGPKLVPPPEVIADAERRAMAPRSLTSLIFQDPEPGRRWPDGRSPEAWA